MFTQLINGADIGMVERGGGSRFALRVAFVRENVDRSTVRSAETSALHGAPDADLLPDRQPPFPTAEHLQNAVVRYLLAKKELLCRSEIRGSGGCRSGLVDRGDKPVTPAREGLHESWLFRVVFEYLADLSDGRVDAAIGIEEDVLSHTRSTI